MHTRFCIRERIYMVMVMMMERYKEIRQHYPNCSVEGRIVRTGLKRKKRPYGTYRWRQTAKKACVMMVVWFLLVNPATVTMAQRVSWVPTRRRWRRYVRTGS